MKLLTSLAVALPLVSARRLAPRGEVVSYDGYKVVRVDTHTDVEAVESRIASLHTVNFNPGTSDHLDLAVGPKDVETFEALGLDYKVVHEDLGADIKLEGSLKPYSGKDDACPAELPHMDWFDSYHPYEDHLDFIKDLHLAFPKNSEIVHVGESYEGRDIVGIHFWGEGGRGSKPAVYWHGTVHAREWITTMTVEYIAYQLIKGFLSEDEEVQKYVNDYDFYIIPVVNPDGFVHSQTTDRMWRKNRQPRCNETCVGTDLNRNWPHLWDTPNGASTDPCAQSYRGLAPGDTPEMRAFVKFTDKVAAASAGGIKLFIDWHAYGQLILLPYGGNCSAQIDNYDRQMELAGSTAEAIEAVHGSAHVFGPVCDVLYAASGGSMDYVFDVAGAELAWAMELRPGSAAGGGFVLPADQILPTAEENWAGMRYLLKTM